MPSKEKQDVFVQHLIKESGTFLDVGSYDPYNGNNTIVLEELGWMGIAIDNQEKWVQAMNFSPRITPCFHTDVTSQHFIDVLTEQWPDKHFDYISMDADEASAPAIKLLVDNGYTFDVMTFEHDLYKEGDFRKKPSVETLTNAGYKILFEDVMTDQTDKPILEPWEDWWVSDRFFNKLHLGGKNKSYHEIIDIMNGDNK